MNREDIILIAQRAGYFVSEGVNAKKDKTTKVITGGKDHWSELVEFADLVASAERERIKQANAPEIERINAHIKQLEDAVKAEREACAKVCEESVEYAGDTLAAAIRARGQA